MSALLVTWKIKHFCIYYERIFSPTFYAENLESTKWKLSLDNSDIYLLREKADECLRKLKVEGKLMYITKGGFESSHMFTAELDEDEECCVCELDMSEIQIFDTLTIQCYLSQSSELSPSMEYVAHTDHPIEKYSIVRNVLLPVSADQELKSDPLYLYATSKYFSRFEILLKSTSESIDVTVDLKELKEDVYVKYKMKLLNSEEILLTAFEGGQYLSTEESEDTDCLDKEESVLSIFVNKKEEIADNWTPNIKIIACFAIISDDDLGTYISYIVSTNYPLLTCHELPENTRGDDVPSLNKRMKAMYVDKKFCDFTIRCRGTEFQVHKAVLATASPVFGAMLDVDMAEKQSSAVNIEDIELDTVSKMIDFLYTDTLNEVEWGSCIDLYFAANKYQIRDLKQNCARYMIKHLDVENVCEVLSISDMHHDADLMKVAKEFVHSHFNKVLQSNQWQSFMENNSKVACSTMYERHKLKTSSC